MFETFSKAPQDKIFALMAEIAADDRPGKIDLGIGVYKDDEGNTPIMSAVKKAEERILKSAKTKSYIGVAGNKAFSKAMVGLALDDAVPADRVRAAQAPGGTGALWVLMQLLKRGNPDATLWVSDPTWPNHKPMAENVGFTVKTYPYFDPETGKVRFEEMLKTLDGLGTNDIVLLHGCCHNPTGANLTPEQWDQVIASLQKTGAFPFIDLAYQGFGDGLEADSYGVRAVGGVLPEVAIATSCSKNFGLYRERVGCAMVIARDVAQADTANSQMLNIIRSAYSQPPDHGAEIVRIILEDEELKAEWKAELEAMRTRMVENRQKLADAIRTRSNSSDFDFVAEHRGMFSLLGLPKPVIDRLKTENAVYMLDDSRINIAGLGDERIQRLADAIVNATR
ncbi:amino acid aminotransferase [Pelagibacterium xiamenense]|uniref:amino acid aminotransferase n=1 Tax=Pelagibacterium xiamenense TaxID=2901140 RepID=UPI001E5EA0A5|nr:amino acid aminotransferase [Pelagibacterium xiamenense]MCD7059181.1 aspartate/tyrosine/aromatic aminotransferase [Pelagibacterium xiamenense]